VLRALRLRNIQKYRYSETVARRTALFTFSAPNYLLDRVLHFDRRSLNRPVYACSDMFRILKLQIMLAVAMIFMSANVAVDTNRHPFSVVRNCLSNIFIASLHAWRSSDPFAVRRRTLNVCIWIWGRFWWGNPKERSHSEDLGVDGRMGLEWILGRLAGRGVEWIHLAEDRDRWRAVVNEVMYLRVLAPRS
jgi:hypothetical protein